MFTLAKAITGEVQRAEQLCTYPAPGHSATGSSPQPTIPSQFSSHPKCRRGDWPPGLLNKIPGHPSAPLPHYFAQGRPSPSQDTTPNTPCCHSSSAFQANFLLAWKTPKYKKQWGNLILIFLKECVQRRWENPHTPQR